MPILNAGLCSTCVFKVVMVSDKGSEFIRCTNPRVEKYPRLPVYACIGFTKLKEPAVIPVS